VALAAPTHAYVNVSLRSDLNVRNKPDFDAKIVGHLFRNDYVKIVDWNVGNGWVQIEYNGSKNRYVRKSYLSTSRPSGGVGKSAFPTLRSGSKVPAVRTLQRNLNTITGAKLTVTGTFDRATRSAVIEFQKANGLTADGIVGKKTWAKIIELR